VITCVPRTRPPISQPHPAARLCARCVDNEQNRKTFLFQDTLPHPPRPAPRRGRTHLRIAEALTLLVQRIKSRTTSPTLHPNWSADQCRRWLGRHRQWEPAPALSLFLVVVSRNFWCPLTVSEIDYLENIALCLRSLTFLCGRNNFRLKTVQTWMLPSLFNCKSRLIMLFFHHFVRLTIKGGLHFFSKVFRWRLVDQTLFSHSVLFSIMCTSLTGGIMMNRRHL